MSITLALVRSWVLVWVEEVLKPGGGLLLWGEGISDHGILSGEGSCASQGFPIDFLSIFFSPSLDFVD